MTTALCSLLALLFGLYLGSRKRAAPVVPAAAPAIAPTPFTLELLLVHFDGHRYRPLWLLGRKRADFEQRSVGMLHNTAELVWRCNALQHEAPTHVVLLAPGTECVVATGALSASSPLQLEAGEYAYRIPRRGFTLDNSSQLGGGSFAERLASESSVMRTLPAVSP